jgi:cytochrome c553
MKKLLLTGAILAAGLISSNVMAADAAAGKAKSATCAGCHGAAGVSMTPMWPNLAGQKAAYLVKQLKAFKDGSRKDATMAGMAAALSDDDMANIAAYYASLK